MFDSLQGKLELKFSLKIYVHELRHELSNDLRLRTLGNYEIFGLKFGEGHSLVFSLSSIYGCLILVPKN